MPLLLNDDAGGYSAAGDERAPTSIDNNVDVRRDANRIINESRRDYCRQRVLSAGTDCRQRWCTVRELPYFTGRIATTHEQRMKIATCATPSLTFSTIKYLDCKTLLEIDCVRYQL